MTPRTKSHFAGSFSWTLLAVALCPAAVRAADAAAAGHPALAVAPFDAAQAKRLQKNWSGYLGLSEQRTNTLDMKFALVPAGEFMMGNGHTSEEETDVFKLYGGSRGAVEPAEYPRHRVRLTQPFYLGMHEVTVGQFRRFVADSGYRTDAEKGPQPGAFGWDSVRQDVYFHAEMSWRNVGFPQTDDHPVVCVSWNDAAEFCKWLSRKEGQPYRLPTEAEWEYACRAGTTTRYACGDDPESLAQSGNVADGTFRTKFPNHGGETLIAADGYQFTVPVGRFRPNAFGLYDMHGNAWEWCADWYAADYYAWADTVDPLGPGLGTERVVRGGSWVVIPSFARSAYREGRAPDNRRSGVGFRVALTLRAPAATPVPSAVAQKPAPDEKEMARTFLARLRAYHAARPAERPDLAGDLFPSVRRGAACRLSPAAHADHARRAGLLSGGNAPQRLCGRPAAAGHGRQAITHPHGARLRAGRGLHL